MTLSNLHFYRGNAKLSRWIHGINLPPILSCRPGVPCAHLCYARKADRLYRQARDGWRENLRAFQLSPTAYFRAIARYLSDKRPAYFRWHSAGDIPSVAYYEGMRQIAIEFPDIRFLAYSKRTDIAQIWDAALRPDNLVIMQSLWLGESSRPAYWPTFSVLSKADPMALLCPGHCGSPTGGGCLACYHARPGQRIEIRVH